MQVVCEATQSTDIKVKVAALQCLVKIMSLYYNFMEPYMGPALFAITLDAMKSQEDEVREAFSFGFKALKSTLFFSRSRCKASSSGPTCATRRWTSRSRPARPRRWGGRLSTCQGQGRKRHLVWGINSFTSQLFNISEEQ